MKKYFGMLALVFLMISGMKTGVMAQNQALSPVNMFKDVSSSGRDLRHQFRSLRRRIEKGHESLHPGSEGGTNLGQ